MKISIIVPTYNVEHYLEKCIQSVLHQTYTEFELLLIDDGSTDLSPLICDKYAETDSRIRVFHQKNSGPMSACRAGINNSTGDYICFIDSDDYVLTDYLERLIKPVLDNNAEIVITDYSIIKNDIINNLKSTSLPAGLYQKNQIENEIFPNIISNNTPMGKIIKNTRWAKLFKSDIMKNNIGLLSDEFRNGEDFQLVFVAILDCDTVYVIRNYFGYIYRDTLNSITNLYKPKLWYNHCKLNEFLLQIASWKTTYNFSLQLTNDYLCYGLASISNEFCCKWSFNKNYDEVKKIVCDKTFRNALYESTVKYGDLFSKLIILLSKLRMPLLITAVYKLNNLRLKRG